MGALTNASRGHLAARVTTVTLSVIASLALVLAIFSESGSVAEQAAKAVAEPVWDRRLAAREGNATVNDTASAPLQPALAPKVEDVSSVEGAREADDSLLNDAEKILRVLAPMPMEELRGELRAFGLPLQGEKAVLIERIQRHVLAHLEGTAERVMEQDAADSGFKAAAMEHIDHGLPVGGASLVHNATDVEARRLGSGTVFCICKMSSHSLVCVDSFFTLLMCYPNCAAACDRRGLGYQGCNNPHMIRWLKRLRYTYKACAGDDS